MEERLSEIEYWIGIWSRAPDDAVACVVSANGILQWWKSVPRGSRTGTHWVDSIGGDDTTAHLISTEWLDGIGPLKIKWWRDSLCIRPARHNVVKSSS